MTVETCLLILFAAAAAVAGAATAALIRHDRELIRLARNLAQRDPEGNARLTLGMRSPGLTALARAVNGELDRERARRIADTRAQAAFQEDLASLSHDIRTPLAGAQGYLQLAERAADPSEQRRYLEQAVDRLQDMRALVDGLFDYAKASDPALELAHEPVALLPALSDALLGFYPAFTARGWEPAIRFADEDARVLADEEALSRVLTNLVSNALRYGTGAPTICQDHRATDGREDAGGGTVVLTFSNPVAEPSKIDAARLFDRFYKAEAARTGQGNGLGLAIVAKLVGAMGGAAHARIEGGSLVIEIALPAA